MATLEESDRGGGRWVVVPPDVRAAFGEARPPLARPLRSPGYFLRLRRIVTVRVVVCVCPAAFLATIVSVALSE